MDLLVKGCFRDPLQGWRENGSYIRRVRREPCLSHPRTSYEQAGDRPPPPCDPRSTRRDTGGAGQDLAIDQSNVSAIERGIRGLTIHQAVRLAKALKVTTDDILMPANGARSKVPQEREARPPGPTDRGPTRSEQRAVLKCSTRCSIKAEKMESKMLG